jgi:GTP-dependent phosphoenolpyruvate carboxykinase
VTAPLSDVVQVTAPLSYVVRVTAPLRDVVQVTAPLSDVQVMAPLSDVVQVTARVSVKREGEIWKEGREKEEDRRREITGGRNVNKSVLLPVRS